MRPKSTGRDLPPRMLRRVRKGKNGQKWESYFYAGRDAAGKRVELPLGTDLVEAKRKWAEYEAKPPSRDTGEMNRIFDEYVEQVVPTKAPRTQKDNEKELKQLRAVFGAMAIDRITPHHIARYRDGRMAKPRWIDKTKPKPKPVKAPTRANRELALLSHVFNFAREKGYVKTNPVQGVRKNRETPRDFYADQAVWDAVYAVAVPELQDAMDLAYLTGQRPADVLKMRIADIRNGALEVKQNKTDHKLRIVVGEGSQLAALVKRITERPVVGLYLLATAKGETLTYAMLRTRWDDARGKAATASPDLAERIEQFQFRDIRPRAASDIENLAEASKLLGHTEQEITKKVYRRTGEVVQPTR